MPVKGFGCSIGESEPPATTKMGELGVVRAELEVALVVKLECMSSVFQA